MVIVVLVAVELGGALGVQLALKEGSALLDEGLELDVRDVREGEGEDGAGLRGDEGEVAVEEDRVEDAWSLCSSAGVVTCDSLGFRSGIAMVDEGGIAAGQLSRDGGNSPFTTSLTDPGSAKASSMNSAGPRCSMVPRGISGRYATILCNFQFAPASVILVPSLEGPTRGEIKLSNEAHLRKKSVWGAGEGRGVSLENPGFATYVAYSGCGF